MDGWSENESESETETETNGHAKVKGCCLAMYVYAAIEGDNGCTCAHTVKHISVKRENVLQ